MTKVFIDGKQGTTGLKIYERFKERSDIELLVPEEKQRKDVKLRAEMINESDVTFLCLPDEASIEAVGLVKNPDTRIIDASTAHRTDDTWDYGFPEIAKSFRQNIEKSKRVTVPGCHASGFIALVYPLISSGILPKDYPLACYSLTGYSGGGRKMIEEYEAENTRRLLAPRQYALGQRHKHLKEMKYICKLDNEPIFLPIVCNYYSGMEVSVPLYTALLEKVKGYMDVYDFLKEYYGREKMLDVKLTDCFTDGFAPANFLQNSNKMELYVGGNDERILLTALYDNLGKGASGAAVQCMNIMLGTDETTGLI